jgi:hypothetical protein
MVEAPGTAPGSEWFIAAAIYRHSRQAGTVNIGVKRPRRKSRRAVRRLRRCSLSVRPPVGAGARPLPRGTFYRGCARGRRGRNGPRSLRHLGASRPCRWLRGEGRFIAVRLVLPHQAALAPRGDPLWKAATARGPACLSRHQGSDVARFVGSISRLITVQAAAL